MKTKPNQIRTTWPTVYAIDDNGTTRYRVDARKVGYSDKRYTRNTIAEAKKLAADIEADFLSQGTSGVISNELKLEALVMNAKLAKYGKTLTQATEHYISFLLAEEQKLSVQTVNALMAEWDLTLEKCDSKKTRDSKRKWPESERYQENELRR